MLNKEDLRFDLRQLYTKINVKTL